MIIGNIPELSEKLPERPKKVSHETGEIFQMFLNRKMRENNERDKQDIHQWPDNRHY
jgi:hypothetical protein